MLEQSMQQIRCAFYLDIRYYGKASNGKPRIRCNGCTTVKTVNRRYLHPKSAEFHEQNEYFKDRVCFLYLGRLFELYSSHRFLVYKNHQREKQK